MKASVSQYLLFSKSSNACEPGHWQFLLQSADGTDRLAVDDVEPDVRGERLELLAVVRGLESLDQPSQVTVITPSVYVRKGIECGIAEWRQNDWRWEFFGEMVPVKDNDLWQRLDRAMQFHQLKCRTLRFDPPHAPARPAGRVWAGSQDRPAQEPSPAARGLPMRWQGLLAACRGLIREAVDPWRERLARLHASFAPAFGLIRLF